ncbi:MAG TPA: hypothetical protein PL018_11490 [Ignavibacteriaceae bacterium]|nr:hypothetical protein [Ignavibacteriaceae bacterium]HRN26217.1 hypothetical protein [Ignavibacteriaceae bacterium]HRP93923.1 hypothetical protein [Ignavibacteriaceae bacterium]HRQ54872.1 hypothetical protein [Ignavibacteriaceae bacterium]
MTLKKNLKEEKIITQKSSTCLYYSVLSNLGLNELIAQAPGEG